ncbi:MAG: TolC family protein [Blastocatellia bacterium]
MKRVQSERVAMAVCCLLTAAGLSAMTGARVTACALQTATRQAQAQTNQSSAAAKQQAQGSDPDSEADAPRVTIPINLLRASLFDREWSFSRQATPAASPTTPQTAAPINLSLADAVQLALRNNLQARLAHERRREAGGLAAQSRAGLLPNLSANIIQQDLTVNLAAQGFPPGLFPGLNSTLIGPFRRFDARVTLLQPIFNLSAIRQFEAGRINTGIAGLQEQLANQQVASQTAQAYLNALSAERAVDAALANLELARSLLQLAQNQHTAGVATGVDVTRAETRVAEERVRVAQAQANAHSARFELLRLTGLPLASRVTLTETLQFTPEPFLVADATVAEAERDRIELRIARQQVELASRNRQAAEAEQLPSIDFLGDYGESGNTPRENALPTRSVGVRVNLPLFNGGLTRGRITVAASRQRQAELQFSDLRAQVEEDVRLAIETLTTATEQVTAAQLAVRLAERELQMSRDRFAAGVTNNIEVVNAQTALANARQNEVAALAQYNAARINLAAARGRIESFRW